MNNLLVYNASAGSGKTYTLVREYLSLALSGDVFKFKSVLAVTFTNKAAKEMKNRILTTLYSFFSSEKKDSMYTELRDILKINDEELVSRAKRLYYILLHNYSDLAVCTIDTFVQKLSRSFAKELSLPYQYSVILDDDDLIDDVIIHISDDINASKDNFITELLVDFIEYRLMDEEKGWRIENPIRDFIKTILKENAYRKGQYQDNKLIDKQQFDNIKKYLVSEIARLCNVLNSIVMDLEAWERSAGLSDLDYSYGDKGLPSVKKKMKAYSSNVLTERSMKMLEGNAKCLKNNTELTDAVIDRYNKAIDDYNKIIRRYFVLSLIRNRSHLQVLRNYLYDYIDISITESNNVHLSEFNKRISEILGDCSVPFIYERLGEKYSHFFIDEFQDTSILQWQNFLPLVYNSLSNNNKNLLVGDAKQSIYRFRSGEVEQIINIPRIFNKPNTEFARDCENKFENEYHPVSLNTNYRSTETVVKFNNLFFDKFCDYAEVITDDNTDYQSVDIKKVYRDVRQDYKKEGGYVSVSLFKMDKNNKESRAEYKDFVDDAVVKRVKDLRNIGYSYKDIVILVRNKNIGSELAKELAKAEIPFVSLDSVMLSASDKVWLIIIVLQYLVKPDDPIIKASLRYYYDLAKNIPDTFLNTESNLDIEKLYDLYNDSYTVYDLCAQIINLMGFNVLDDVFLRFFMNVVYEWQNGNNGGIDSFLEYWDKKNSNFTLVLPENIDAVNIMTIHKAKGLEFKVVIYPYAFTSFPDAGITNSDVWVNVKDYLPEMEDFLLPLTKDGLKNTDFEPLYDREYRKTILDDMNIMYVAMTRSKEMLFVYSNNFGDENIFNNLFFKEEGNSLELNNGRDSLTFKVEYGDNFMEYHSGDYKLFDSEEKDNNNILTYSESVTPLNWRDKLHFEEDIYSVSSDCDELDPRELGILIHEVFSRIKTVDDVDMVLKHYRDDGLLSEDTAKTLKDRFEEMMQTELAVAYDKDAVVRNESDILTDKGEILRPDRYSEYNNKVFLIDYKTGEEHDNYSKQLEKYKHALSEMDNSKDIKAYIVYVNKSLNIIQV